MSSENIVYGKAYKFAIRIVKASKYLSKDQKEYVISKQLLRNGTSIGANISEANGAISKTVFSNKIFIAHKECLETKYWHNLMKDTNYFTSKTCSSIFPKADEIAKILFSVLKSARINN